MLYTYSREFPIAGWLTLYEDEGGLCAVSMGRKPDAAPTPLLKECASQLDQYFEGGRKNFDLPLSMRGTPFQLEVWRALLKIPYGATATYGEVAMALGRPRAARAVGMANHNNPLMILVPCHRVIGKDGSLTGYAGGLPIKRALLELERAHADLR